MCRQFESGQYHDARPSQRSSFAGVNPVKKKKKKGDDDDDIDKEGGQDINPGLDMGRLFKLARNQLFPRPEHGFRAKQTDKGVDDQQHAFAVLTDFGTAPLTKALEKSFETVRQSISKQS